MKINISHLLEKVPCLNRIHSWYTKDKCFFLLLIFFIAVIIFGYILPSLVFGRPFGTDTYTHMYHAQEMYATDSLFDFYEEMGKKVVKPGLEGNLYNYPFGSWLFIAVLCKVANLEPSVAAFIFGILFIFVVAITYYIYSGLFLQRKSQKLFAVLFLLSMPNIILYVNNFRPSTFVIPFLLLAIYSVYSEKITLKNMFLMAMTVFAIAVSHTGTFIYLMVFSICFFWIYCFFGKKFSRPLFALTVSTFLFYWISVISFPHLYQQYATKATIFITPGHFLSEKLHIFFADDLSNILYENLFVEHEFVYVIIWSALVFAVGSFLVFIGKHIFHYFSQFDNKNKFAIIPSVGMSHSVLATPFWIGPIHAILGTIGFFRLDLKGKCLALAVVITTVVPAVMMASEGFEGTTGALREIFYLYIIIPIVAVLGLWYVLQIVREKFANYNALIAFILILIFSSIIITPIIANGYYQPSISGDDYIIEGMQWLSGTGKQNEKVVGYGYRTFPVYAGKMDASYGTPDGTQLRMLINLVKDVFLSKNDNTVTDLYSLYNAKYVLKSKKVINNLNIDDKEVVIDSQKSLDKIFSSRDFGIYGFIQQSNSNNETECQDGQVLFNSVGSNIEIISKIYKVVIDQNTPTIKFIGETSRNYLEEGSIYESMKISWVGNSDDMGSYTFFEEDFTREDSGNQIIYHTILKDDHDITEWSSVDVKYTFNPEMITREFIISNDRIPESDTPIMSAYFSTNIFMPASNFVLKKSMKRIEKDIYPSEDVIRINDVYDSFYFSDGDSGIYIEYGDTAPYPNSVTYKGSTAYDYSSFGVSNSEMISPGSSLHITQYISVGNEEIAKQHIDNNNRITLHPYPDAIVPLVLCEYDSSKITSGFGRTNTFAVGNTSIEYSDVTGVVRSRNTLENIFNDIRRDIPYIVSNAVNPPYLNILFCEGLRHPHMAQYHGETTGLVILPESKPRTQMLSGYYEPGEFFSYWRDVIMSVSRNDDMALFLMRSQELENPAYFQDFLGIISYAEEYGLTETKPEVIASHFRKLQQITYNSSFDIDEATITVTNQNDVPIDGVTFVIQMPILENDIYIIENGVIERITPHYPQNSVYISVDLMQHETKIITVKPNDERKKLFVEFPDSVKEGMVKIVVKDLEGLPVKNALITIDDQPYTTNEFGNVSMELRRGSYNLTVEKAGYMKETLNVDVRNYLYVIGGIIRSFFAS